jgi:predicted DNA-binding protein
MYFMGRSNPTTSESLHLRIPADLRHALERLRERHRFLRTKTATVIFAIERGLEALEQDRKHRG